MGTNYDAKSLTILHGLEPVRERPGMYIGSTSSMGLHHLVWEIVDNAVDEANEGYGKEIKVTIHDDGSLEVEDQGRGVPYDFNTKERKSGFQIVYQTLHGGGKFDESNYKSAGGLHGVGAAVTNALSEYLEVHSYRDGRDHYAKFEKGGSIYSGIRDIGPTSKRGTKVRFLPDKTIFEDTTFVFDKIATHLDDQACLTKGVTFKLKDERNNRSQEFYYKDGLNEYYSRHTVNKVPLTKPMHFEGVDQGIKVEVVFGFMKESYDEKIISFANGVRTSDGGYHNTGFKKAISTCYNKFATQTGLIKSNQPLDGDCLREGMVAILSVWVPEHLLQFEGQTKGKLGTKEALNATDNALEKQLQYYLAENKLDAEAVVRKTINEMRVRDKTDAERKKERELLNNKHAQFNLSDKLTPCSSKDYNLNELFIVEGDSAGGSAKKGRDPKHQAILPLRGKPKNTTDVESETELLGNKEISTMIYTIGGGYGKDFNASSIHYDKVIIMTDADDDGSHIQSLLLTFFYNHMKPLIDEGHVYIACPPLYRVYNSRREIYCYDDDELIKAQKDIGAGYKVNRYKGLGEMNYQQLSETTMDPKKRRLLKVIIYDEDDSKDKVSLFLGKDADRRKEWISNNIDFTTIDSFTREVEARETK